MVCYWRNFYRLVPVTVAAGRTTSVGLDFRRSIGYFVTTPIFYVNAAPHIGHLYSALLADASNRWYILKHPSEKTLFVTGSDEHGIKAGREKYWDDSIPLLHSFLNWDLERASSSVRLIQRIDVFKTKNVPNILMLLMQVLQAANQNSQSVVAYCQKISSLYKDVFRHFNISNSDFIRTTEERHVKAVTAFWNKLLESGSIYKAKYSGWYCVSDETYYSEREIEDAVMPDGTKAKVSTSSGHKVEWTTEENYLFALTKYESKLRKWLQESGVVQPSYIHQFLMNSFHNISDVSVSRQRDRCPWGIEVPGDASQTIYVWFDALVNYLTAAGYPNKITRWPPDCQLVGKDIIKFHAIFWPAFLMAAQLPLPAKILCHGHWQVDGIKMSKSFGNFVDPMLEAKSLTVDGVRYFLLRQGVPQSDNNYASSLVRQVLNDELANCIGNLLSRSTAADINPSQRYPAFDKALFDDQFLAADRQFLKTLEALPGIVAELYDDLMFCKGVQAIMTVMRGANSFFQKHEPWKNTRDESAVRKKETTLHVTYQALRLCGILLQPIIPDHAERLLDRLGIPLEDRCFNKCADVTSLYSVNAASSLGPRILGHFFERLQM